jgi:hypothetical protein
MNDKKQQKRSGLTSFSKSFKPKVRLRDKPCRLHLHFRGALRQVVSRLDYLAALDETGERFVFATIKDLHGHCKDYKTKKPYHPRMLKACVRYLKSKNIIGERTSRERDGLLYFGRVVAEHDKVTGTVGKCCAFRMESMQSASPPASPPASPSASPPASPSASTQNRKVHHPFGV